MTNAYRNHLSYISHKALNVENIGSSLLHIKKLLHVEMLSIEFCMSL